MSDIKRIDIGDFRDAGYLQEANRRFFHPLGLALEIVTETCKACAGSGLMEDGPAGATYSAPCRYCWRSSGTTYRLGGVWDYRDDPEGMMFAAGYGADPEKVARIDREWSEHAEYRQQTFGWVVQPPEDELTDVGESEARG